MGAKYSCYKAIADEYGFNAAMLFSYIERWCNYNKKHNTNCYDGMYWLYQTVDKFQEQFPCLGKRQIVTAINKLVEGGLVIKGHSCAGAHGNTMCYTITDKGVEIAKNKNDVLRRSKSSKCESTGQNEQMNDTNQAIQNEQNESVKSTKCEFYPIIYNNKKNSNKEININTNKTIGDGCGFSDEVNPFGDGDMPRQSDTVYQYAVNNLISLGQRAMYELGSFVDDLSEDIVRHAIDNALDAGVRTWNYVKSILNNYVEANIKSVGDAKKFDDDWKHRKIENHNQTTNKNEPQSHQEYKPLGKWY